MRDHRDLLTLERGEKAVAAADPDVADRRAASGLANTWGAPHVRLRHAMRRYLAAMAATFVMTGVLVFGFNALIDPLWYAGGNKLFARNFAFNERLAKTNLLLAAGAATYDCLVLGSSRVTLLDGGRVNGYRCFNYAFSAGHIGEFIAFARYAKHRGLSPRLVIVGVDAENFAERVAWNTDVPDFVSALAPSPSIWRSYLTLDAFLLSLRTSYNVSPLARYYDRQFVVDVLPERRAYQYLPGVVAAMVGGRYGERHVAQYRALRAVFPDARFIGFVPPVSALVVARRRDAGSLDGLLDANYAARDAFDTLYDFSPPSETTSDRRNHYDDSHFLPEIYDRIADGLNGDDAGFGLDLGTLSRAEYGRAYAEGLARFGGAPTGAAPSH